MANKLPEVGDNIAEWTIAGKVKVTIGWLGEGFNGDYDADNPKDVPLLRFDAYDLAVHAESKDCQSGDDCYNRSPRCRSAQDNSYCTQLPVTLAQPVLESVCRAIADDIADETSWKRALEKWSWLDEKEAKKIHKGYQKPRTKK